MEVDDFVHDPIFIGRETQLNQFKGLLKKVFPIISFPDSSPHLCFVIGPKRSGKSTLVNKMLENRGNWFDHFSDPAVIIRLAPPFDQKEDLTDLIYDACEHPKIGDFNEYEASYHNYKNQVDKLKEVIKNALPEKIRSKVGTALDDVVAGIVGILVSALIQGSPFQSFTELITVIETTRNVSKSFREISKEVFDVFNSWKEANRIDVKEISEYRAKAILALSDDIRKLSLHKRIAFILDDYDSWPLKYDSDLKSFVSSAGHVLWIIVGTFGRVSQDMIRHQWQLRHPTQNIHFIEVNPLTIEEIKNQLTKLNMPQKEEKIAEEAQAIGNFSGGDPALTQLAVTMWQSGELDVKSLSETGKIGDNIIQLLEENLRIWMGQNEKELIKLLFMLAILSDACAYDRLAQEKSEIFTMVGGIEYQHVEKESLFVYRSLTGPDLRSPWKNFLKDRLMTSTTRSDYFPLIKELNDEAISKLKQKQHQIIDDRKLNSWQRRVLDQLWTDLETARLYHSIWRNPDAGWSELVQCLLAAWRYQLDWFKDLVRLSEEISPLMPKAYTADLDLMGKVSIGQANTTEKLELLRRLEEFCGLC